MDEDVIDYANGALLAGTVVGLVYVLLDAFVLSTGNLYRTVHILSIQAGMVLMLLSKAISALFNAIGLGKKAPILFFRRLLVSLCVLFASIMVVLTFYVFIRWI